MNNKASIVRVYLPPDANTLLSVADYCLRSRHYVNLIVAGKQPALQFLSMDEAVKHGTAGLGLWEWASNDRATVAASLMWCWPAPEMCLLTKLWRLPRSCASTARS